MYLLVFPVLPMLVVIWWNREKILTSSFRGTELEENEKQVLSILKERFSTVGTAWMLRKLIQHFQH